MTQYLSGHYLIGLTTTQAGNKKKIDQFEKSLLLVYGWCNSKR